MQDVIDLIVAVAIFLLFSSLYGKRRTPVVRAWSVGWLFIVLHFASAAVQPHGTLASTLQSIAFLSTLVCTAISFVLSRAEIRTTPGRAVAAALLLGAPWLTGVIFASLPNPHPAATAICGYLGALAMAAVALISLRRSRPQLVGVLLVLSACLVWLSLSLHTTDPDLLVEIILTECYGLVAVLMSDFGWRRLSAATVTSSAGAIAWGFVWVGAVSVGHFAPALHLNPELYNLPKYFLAAGMILTLLEEEIRSAELASEQYRLLFASNPHPMWMYDLETLQFLQANEAAVLHYGYSQDEFRRMGLLEILSEDQSPQLKEKLAEISPRQLSGPWLHRHKDGSTFQVDIASQPVVLDGRRVMFAFMHDITDRERLHSQLIRQAQHDVLTDLPKRDLFEQRLRAALERVEGDGGRLAIVCIDLDRFKQINDSYGHLAGDICLKEAAARIGAVVQGRGTVARTGGDEFMVYLEGLASAAAAEECASELLRCLREPVQIGNGELELGGSIGFALYPDDGTDYAQLWRDADAAMYQAKRAGGAEWVRVSAEISTLAQEAGDIEIGLRRALRHGGLEIHFQPQVTDDGELFSLEALLRASHPALHLVPTLRIINIAEESGLIVPLGLWVLEEVCRQFRVWLDEGIAPRQVAVNVSPLQLTRFDFSQHVAALLERYGLDAHMLEFEVTESTMMPERGTEAPHQIADLARMGIRFSVDDFGTGYSSLGRLHQLPVDALKIDRSFTSRLAERAGTYPTVEAIIVLAHTFGMKVVAEGVETREQHRLLRALGCDRLQGMLFGMPASAEITTELLRVRQERLPVRSFAPSHAGAAQLRAG